MRFFPTPSPLYFAPASYRQLQEDGTLKEFQFDLQLQRMTRTELDAIDAMVKDLTEKGKPTDMPVLARVCKGWRVKPPQPEGSTDEPQLTVVTFTEQAAKELEDEYPGFIGACVRAFYLAQQPGRAAHFSTASAAAEKN